MRENKFRAWDKRTKSWIKERLLLMSEAGKLYKLSDDNLGVDYYDMNNVDIVFYTGLKGKDGKEIYEGDIVKKWYPQWDDDKDKEYLEFLGTYFVTCDEGWFFELSKPNNGVGIVGSGTFENVEIIGNIYENQELLSDVKHALGDGGKK